MPPFAEIRIPAPWAAVSSTVDVLFAIRVVCAGGAKEGIAGDGAVSGLDDEMEACSASTRPRQAHVARQVSCILAGWEKHMS